MGLGAFCAHALAGYLIHQSLSADQAQRALDTWEVAVRYQLYHALALLAAGLLSTRAGTRATWIAGWAFVVGTAVFSGCLYALVLSGVRRLGAIVPFGGVLLIVGWLALLYAGLAAPASRAPVHRGVE